MFNRLAALGLIALGATGIILSVQIWQPCFESAVSEQCRDAMSARAHWPTAFGFWAAGVGLAIVGALSRAGRWASLAATVLLLVAAHPAFDPGIGTWDTADAVPGSGIISASWLLLAGAIIGVGGIVEQRRIVKQDGEREPVLVNR